MGAPPGNIEAAADDVTSTNTSSPARAAAGVRRRRLEGKACTMCGAPQGLSVQAGEAGTSPSETEESSGADDCHSPPPSPSMFETIFYESKTWPSHSGRTWRGWAKHKALVVYLLAKWAFQLIIAAGPVRLCRWVWLLGRILVFVSMLLLQVFIPMVFHYYTSHNIIRDVPYHDNRKTVGRSVLDVYLPKKASGKQARGKKAPVVIFFVGGAWIVGYKAWGALLARLLSAAGVLCFCPDYRNFPQATVSDMLADTDRAITWIQNNVEAYGGDPDNVLLMGQSAGAHLTLTCLLRRTREEAAMETLVPGRGKRAEKYRMWSTRGITGYVGLSGPYNLVDLLPHFQTRGLYQSVMNVVFEASQGGVRSVSPAHLLDDYPEEHLDTLAEALPPVYLYHGTRDKSVPCWSSLDLSTKLTAFGCRVACKLLEGHTHTRPIIEGPVAGDDTILQDLLYLLFSGRPDRLPPTGHFSGSMTSYLEDDVVPRGLVESVLTQAPCANRYALKIAGLFNPF